MSILLTPELANGGWYDDLNRAYYTDQATLRSTNIRGRSGTGRYLVAAHGFGHLVQGLITAGNADTWGFDLSQYAVDQSKLRYPNLASRFVLGDARSTSSMATVRQQTAGGPASRLFNVIVSEDLLSVCGPFKRPNEYTSQDWIDAQAEALQMAAGLRSILAPNGILVHIISMSWEENPATNLSYAQGFWRTGEQWRSILPASDYIVRLYDLVGF